MRNKRLRPLVAEAVGTAFLLAAIVGSGVMAERLAAPNEALALLCNALPTGAMLLVLVLIFAPVSGAHFNPVVSLSAAARGELAWATGAAYLIAQVIGAAIGVMIAHVMFGLPVVQLAQKARFGLGQWVGEFVATWGLLLAIYGGRGAGRWGAPVAVGLYITAAYWFTASTSFANPVVTIARTFTDTFTGIAPADAPAFIAAQVLATACALPVCKWLFDERG